MYLKPPNQPKPFWTLAFGELCNTFSYFGTQTILVLYLIHTFGLNQTDSYVLYGTYVAFAYSLPIIGGIVADKWLTAKKAAIIGGGLCVLGNLILMLPQHYLFCLGIATSLIGASLYKSNAMHLVGELYEQKNTKKETGFTLVYLAVNIGGVLGPLIYSTIIYYVSWNFGFLCSAVGIFISTAWLIKCQSLLKEIKPKSFTKPEHILVGSCIIATCLLLSLPFYIPKLANLLIITVFIIGFIYLLIALRKYVDRERRHLIALLVVSFFGIFYFAAGLQVGSTVTLFIQHSIQNGLIHTQLPASIFSIFYPLFVLLLAPFFTYFWHWFEAKGISIKAPAKLGIGLLLAVFGISAFAIATTATTNFIMLGIVMGNFLLSAGELVITPAVYTAVSNLSPNGMKSTMIGCWFLCVALGGYLSSILANASNLMAHIHILPKTEYLSQFIFIAGFIFIVVLILMAFTPKLTKMMQ